MFDRFPDPDRVDVTAQHRIEPDARILADLHLTDQTRTCRDEHRRVHARGHSVMPEDVHGRSVL